MVSGRFGIFLRNAAFPSRTLLTLLFGGLAAVAALDCGRAEPPGEANAGDLLARLRTDFAEALPAGDVILARSEGGFVAESETARIALPAAADGRIAITAGVHAQVALAGATNAKGTLFGDTVIYPDALGDADLVLRAVDGGFEDHLHFPSAPPRSEVRYRLALDPGTGLRLVAGVLELVGEDGNPGLRVEPPHLVDAHGARHAATLSIDDCEVDRDPRPPWGRALTPPGSDQCTMTVRWGDVAYPALLDPTWITTENNLMAARRSATITELSPGKADTLLLIAGGYDVDGDALASAELYHPLHRSFAVTGSMSQPRGDHAAATLAAIAPTGVAAPVLVSGGRASASGAPLASIEIYNPSTGTFVADAASGSARASHTATPIGDATVLLAGGFGAANAPQSSAAVYTFTGFDMSGAPQSTLVPTTGTMTSARARHASVRLATGEVLVTGGATTALQATSSAEIFTPDLATPANGTFGPIQVNGAAGQMSVPRARHTATLLANGSVLVAGGTNGSLFNNVVDVYLDGTGAASLEGFELVATAITMITPRADHAAVRLPTGHVVLVGGLTTGNVVTGKVESFNPTTKSFAPLPDTTPRRDMAALRVKGGGSTLGGDAVLVAGGRNATSTALASAELLVKTNGEGCTVDGECLSGHCVEGICCDELCGGECRSCLAALKGSGSNGECGPVQSGYVLPQKCVNATEVTTECDGAGNVVTTGAKDCKPNTCDATGTKCEVFCTIDADCDGGWCDLSMNGQGGAGGSPAGTGGTGGTGGMGGMGGMGGAGAAGGAGGAGGIGGAGGAGGIGGAGVGGGGGNGLVGLCRDLQSNGVLCTADNQCESGHCVDGLCCNLACEDVCMACDLEGSQGKCSLVPAGDEPHGVDANGVPKACPGSDTCAARCDGATATSCELFPGAETILASTCTCSEADCTLTNQICDGQGTSTEADLSCQGYRCADETSCATTCESDADCILDFICEDGSCVELTAPSCDGEQTLRVPAADDVDCAPYRCTPGESACPTTCASVDDCIAPAVCNAAGQCVPQLTAPELPACECRAPGGPRSGSPAWLALSALALAGLRRVRARAR